MADRFPNGFPAAQVLDFSGNVRHLTAAPPEPFPDYQNSNFPPENNVFFYPARSPLKSAAFAAAVSLRHVFTLAKSADGTQFGAAFRGLLSGLGAGNFGILVGQQNTNRFVNIGFGAAGAFVYKKSQIVYPESNQLAPFAKFELLEVSLSTGWLLDGIQLGGDRETAARVFSGGIGETIGYGRVLSANETAAVNLYYDLKFGLWRLNNTILNFPNPNLTGLLYARYFADVPDYKKVIVSHEYADGGKSFSESAAVAPRKWELEFTCTGANHSESKAKSDIFDAFYNQARESRPFSFTDKYGETHTNVRIEDYDRSHQGHKSWNQRCRFKLVKLP